MTFENTSPEYAAARAGAVRWSLGQDADAARRPVARGIAVLGRDVPAWVGWTAYGVLAALSVLDAVLTYLPRR